MKRALITGITGQDGSYLAELLLAKGYEVHGIKRRSSSFNTHRIDHLYLDEHEHQGRLHMHFGELADASRLTNLIWELRRTRSTTSRPEPRQGGASTSRSTPGT